ncbi:MAG1360 family OppF-related protein [Mycoplasmopsis glycophila]|uniref:MAG1360 family OppF-related protein n=1 Tax=Mycoplasmopsis glycophila TaxID=171285 RepID=UPI000481AC69|nr:hypothetical protein [Mycoplasmopsis glycophila]
MQNKKNLLTIHNIFAQSNLSENEVDFITLPYVEIFQNEKTAFYINEKNSLLTFDLLWKNIVSNKNVSLAFFDQDSNNKNSEFVTNKKEVLKKMGIFNILEVINEDDENIPLFEIWENILALPTAEKLEKEANQLFKDFDFTLKNVLFNIINKYSKDIIDLNQENIREANLILSKISNNDIGYNPNLFSESIKTLNELSLDYKNDLLDILIELFNAVRENHNKILESYELSNIVRQKRLIENSKKRLFYINEIKNGSINKLQNSIKIRDFYFEIDFYKKLLRKTKKKSLNLLNYLLKVISRDIKTLKWKLSIVNRESSKFLEIYKDISIKKRVYALLKRNKSKLYYLKAEKIWKLNNYLNTEIKIFINETYRTKKEDTSLNKINKLSKLIYYEFNFNIDKYILESKDFKNKIENEIKEIQSKINKLEKLNFEKILNTQSYWKIDEFERRIKMSEAELQWFKLNEKKLFNSIIKNKEIRIKRLSASFQAVFDELELFKERFTWIKNNYPSIFKENIEMLNNLNHFYDYFYKFKKMISFLSALSDFTTSKAPANKKIIEIYKNILNFSDFVENLSISNANYLIPYCDLKLVDRAKIKLMKFILSKTKLLFVKDSNFITSDIRLEFLRVLFKISEKYNLNFVFVTSHSGLIKANFDRVHFFGNYSLLEGGLVSEVFENPIHPIIYEILVNKKYSLLDVRDTKEYVYDDLFYVDDDNHYVFASLDEFQKWISKRENRNLSNYIAKNPQFNSTMETTVEIEGNEMVNIFYNQEFIITQNNKKSKKVQKNEDLELYNELLSSSEQNAENKKEFTFDENNEQFF